MKFLGGFMLSTLLSLTRVVLFLFSTTLFISCPSKNVKQSVWSNATSTTTNTPPLGNVSCSSWTADATTVATIPLSGVGTFTVGTDQIYYYNGYLYTIDASSNLLAIDVSIIPGTVFSYDSRNEYAFIQGIVGSTLYVVSLTVPGQPDAYDLLSYPTSVGFVSSFGIPLTFPLGGGAYLFIRRFAGMFEIPYLATVTGNVYSFLTGALLGTLPGGGADNYTSFDIDASTGIAYAFSNGSFSQINLNTTASATFTDNIAVTGDVQLSKFAVTAAAFDGNGCMFFADTYNSNVKKTSTDGTEIAVLVAGDSTTGVALSGVGPGADGPGTSATFASPSAIAYGDYNGKPALYVMDVDDKGQANLRVITLN